MLTRKNINIEVNTSYRPIVETTNVETETEPDNFSETKTEIETGKFRDLRFETQTRNNRDRDRDQIILQKYSTFSIIPKTIDFYILSNNLRLHFN